jgi:hypothetical protein
MKKLFQQKLIWKKLIWSQSQGGAEKSSYAMLSVAALLGHLVL